MSPMSLLTLPAEALQLAAQHPQQSPHGERAERRRTQFVVVALMLVPLGLTLFSALHR